LHGVTFCQKPLDSSANVLKSMAARSPSGARGPTEAAYTTFPRPPSQSRDGKGRKGIEGVEMTNEGRFKVCFIGFRGRV